MGEANLDKFERDDLDKKSQAEAVMSRLTGKGLVCPDCGKVYNDVLVERFEHRIFKIDLVNNKLIENPDMPSRWEINDWAYHCPHCDSLNIDEEVKLLGLNKPQGWYEP